MTSRAGLCERATRESLARYRSSPDRWIEGGQHPRQRLVDGRPLEEAAGDSLSHRTGRLLDGKPLVPAQPVQSPVRLHEAFFGDVGRVVSQSARVDRHRASAVRWRAVSGRRSVLGRGWRPAKVKPENISAMPIS